MILTKEEYLALGFDDGSGAQNADKLLTDCIKRAEYVVNGLTDGAAARTALNGGMPAEYVKQACGFQAQTMLRYEIAREEYKSSLKETSGSSESESSSENGSESSGSSQSSQNAEKVTIGDFSYSVSSGSSSGNSSSNSSGSSSSSSHSSSYSSFGEAEAILPFETDTVIVSLLRAAGCLYAAAEVRE